MCGLQYCEDCLRHGEWQCNTTTFLKEHNAATGRGSRRGLCRCIQRPVATLCKQDLGKQWYSINVELFCTAVNELNLNQKKKKERRVGP